MMRLGIDREMRDERIRHLYFKDKMTKSEIARRMGCSWPRVHQVIVEAEKKSADSITTANAGDVTLFEGR